ncbi:uncharacterized protein K02A2.6-like [Plodia interpunctella]|uniref:uncharacterized protein K02A2.6-like n=1 Tax=Plodia interpunctella TaxID=58824 RepID=UPI0031017FF1
MTVKSSRYCEVFEDGLGRFTGGKVGFRLKSAARPVFLRARPLAYALREPVERALDQMVRDGILSPVTSSDWATPSVPVMKKDGTIRICGDFKLTLNKCLEVDRFPLPRVEDLLTKLHGGQKFSKIDLSQAYAQLELDDSKECTVITTHKGLFMYNRLIYGLASSPGIFQRKLEQLFGDLPQVGVFLDDVIITGLDDKQHLATLEEVFSRLRKYGLKVKKDKCTFFADSVTYLGLTISEKGVHTCPEKIEAIKNAAAPTNVTELRSFLGLVMYYARFVPNVSTVLSPLYELLRKDNKYEWNKTRDRAFQKIKKMLVSSEVLAHYSPDLPLLLTTDASSVGVGAVISHVTPGGERPIAYASRALNTAEKSYSQIEREALAIIYGVRKFHQYLYGRKFTLRTDHKPLVTIFGDKTGIPVMAASRMQRWAVILAGYHYDIEYVRSENNVADTLSRLPIGPEPKPHLEATYIKFIQDFLPVTRKEVVTELVKDEVIKRVVRYIQSGWPPSCTDSELKPYFTRRNELYLDMGCVVWGYRLVIPSSLRKNLLKEMHIGHLGIVKMKSIARGIVWWPGIDADIERVCKDCATCVAEGSAPPRAPPQSWPYAPEPWTRLHADFLGPIQGYTFLVIIDSTTKWIEVFHMNRTTASSVIKVLRETFARFGLPRQIVSDNGPPFSSREYADFMSKNGIMVTFSAAYHPSSNGAAEGAVKLCKRAVKKAMRDKIDIDAALQSYLMAYRNVEHSTTGVSPASLLQHRQLRSRLDLLKGDRQVVDRVHKMQQKQMNSAGGMLRNLNVGEKVKARNFSGKNKWLMGTIEQKLGSRHYLIGREEDPPIKRHIDQVATLNVPSASTDAGNEAELSTTEQIKSAEQVVDTSTTSEHRHSDVTYESEGAQATERPVNETTSTNAPPVNLPSGREPPRVRKRPLRFGFEID